MEEYAYTVDEQAVSVEITKNGVVVDVSGPWESVDAATSWAEVMVSRLNSGTDVL
jgi:hypothetical protein